MVEKEVKFSEVEFEILEVIDYSSAERRDLIQNLGAWAEEPHAYAGCSVENRNLIF